MSAERRKKKMPNPGYVDVDKLIIHRVCIAAGTPAHPTSTINYNTPIGGGANGLNWSDVREEISTGIAPSFPNLALPPLQDYSGIATIGDVADLIFKTLFSTVLKTLQRMTGQVGPQAITPSTQIGAGAGQFSIPSPGALNDKFESLNLPSGTTFTGITTVEDLIYFIIANFLAPQ